MADEICMEWYRSYVQMVSERRKFRKQIFTEKKSESSFTKGSTASVRVAPSTYFRKESGLLVLLGI